MHILAYTHTHTPAANITGDKLAQRNATGTVEEGEAPGVLCNEQGAIVQRAAPGVAPRWV